jgi:hypothetical protein
MDLNSLSAYTSISQWILFLGIGLLVFGIIEKREYYILSGQIAFILLGILAIWIILPSNHSFEANSEGMTKELKALAFFRGAVFFMGLTFLSILQKLFKLPFQKTGIYMLIFFALLLFFMLFNIIQMPNIPSSI